MEYNIIRYKRIIQASAMTKGRRPDRAASPWFVRRTARLAGDTGPSIKGEIDVGGYHCHAGVEFETGVYRGICDGIEEAAKATRTFAIFRDISGRRNDEDPNQVILIENWDTVDHYKAYIAWRTKRVLWMRWTKNCPSRCNWSSGPTNFSIHVTRVSGDADPFFGI